MSAPYSPLAIANEFIDASVLEKNPVTPMKLLKLVYFAEGWHLGLAGKPLTTGEFQAWKFGPVIPSLYREIRDYGNTPINELIADPFYDEDESDDEYPRMDPLDVGAFEIFRAVWDVHKTLTAMQLSDMTHASGTPWRKIHDRYSGRIPPWTVIGKDEIKQYFMELRSAPAGAAV